MNQFMIHERCLFYSCGYSDKPEVVSVFQGNFKLVKMEFFIEGLLYEISEDYLHALPISFLLLYL